jgi:hypothetical protein
MKGHTKNMNIHAKLRVEIRVEVLTGPETRTLLLPRHPKRPQDVQYSRAMQSTSSLSTYVMNE